MALPKVFLAPERIRRAQFSVKKSVENEFPFRTGPGCTHAGFPRWQADHGDAHQVVAGPSARSRLDDDFALHVRVDRAEVVKVARGCKSERELGVLGKHF